MKKCKLIALNSTNSPPSPPSSWMVPNTGHGNGIATTTIHPSPKRKRNKGTALPGKRDGIPNCVPRITPFTPWKPTGVCLCSLYPNSCHDPLAIDNAWETVTTTNINWIREFRMRIVHTHADLSLIEDIHVDFNQEFKRVILDEEAINQDGSVSPPFWISIWRGHVALLSVQRWF